MMLLKQNVHAISKFDCSLLDEIKTELLHEIAGDEKENMLPLSTTGGGDTVVVTSMMEHITAEDLRDKDALIAQLKSTLADYEMQNNRLRSLRRGTISSLPIFDDTMKFTP